jgi:hypothetical protein
MPERETASGPPEQAPVVRPDLGRGLEICPCCNSDLVYPVDWEPAESRRWRVGLRCPDCEWLGGGVYSQEVVDAFDEALDLGTETLLEALTQLTRANLEDQVERFLAALEADLILPEDF